MLRQFTSESVSSGHPDKLADQISDAILDEFLMKDPDSKVACEVFITDGFILVGGEAHSNAYVDVQRIVRNVIKEVGYMPEFGFDPDNCGVLVAIHQQSSDIRQGVEREEVTEQGAGDQGIMFGYACNETNVYLPATLHLAHETLRVLEECRKTGLISGLGPDSKCQYTLLYNDENKPVKIESILVSSQHTENKNLDELRREIHDIVIPRVMARNLELAYLFDCSYKLLINPTGRFVIGGPKGDTGLTGRKIIVDTYGGWGAHGGGAFSGKDPSKVDRSAAYMARFLAKNIVASGVCNRCLIQLSYAIGVAEPQSIFVETDKGKEIDELVRKCIIDHFILKPYSIIKFLNLQRPLYKETATYGHFGRNGNFNYFPWERIMTENPFKELLDRKN